MGTNAPMKRIKLENSAMMRWWNSDVYTKEKKKHEGETGDVQDLSVESVPKKSSSQEQDDTESPIQDVKTRKWTFTVRADTHQGEVLCVTGNCSSLGNWKHDKVLVLTKVDEVENIWRGSVQLPLDQDVEYRYVVCILVEPEGTRLNQRHVVVRRWETHTRPRTISKRVDKSPGGGQVDQLSFYDSKEKLERGWLTTETAIQLKLFSNHLQIWKSKLNGRKIFVKVTPVNLTRCNSVSQDLGSQEECLSLETMDLSDRSDSWPVTEISVMNQGEREFRMQEQFGRAFESEDFIIFQILVHIPESVAILIDFYSYPPFHHEEEPPNHVGFSYILPSTLKNSEGQACVPITSTRHRPIGQITLEYIVVKPTENYICDLSGSQQRRWEESWQGLDVGHRGAGNSFCGNIKQCAEVRENTIASLKRAASHGADFVEFDVQLSKDLVPVLYHDFHVLIAMRSRKDITLEETIQLPVKDLTFKQLQLLKLYHLSEKGSSIPRFSDEDVEEHQPFPTLQQAMEVLDESVGFDIEIKWTMQLKDGTYELYHPFDLNLYLDTVLEVVLKFAGSRSIVFSCFHPDICSMIRLKQNKYPVMFLTQGITDKYPAYHDPRCQTIPIAVHFAVSMDILGINVHTEDLLRDSSQIALVKRTGLVLFCWGDDNNDMETNKLLKQLGIHAVIYDKIDQYSSKEVKESIFRLEARGTERHLIKEAAERAQTDEYLHSPVSPGPGAPCKQYSSLGMMPPHQHLPEELSSGMLSASNSSGISVNSANNSSAGSLDLWPQAPGSLATSVDSDHASPAPQVLPPQSTTPA